MNIKLWILKKVPDEIKDVLYGYVKISQVEHSVFVQKELLMKEKNYLKMEKNILEKC